MKNTAAAIPVAIALLGSTVLPPSEMGTPAAAASAAILPPFVLQSPFAVHFLDVGTGDSAIIDIGDEEVIIDGGDSVKVLTDYVQRTGIIDGPVELVIVTHGDSDHWKGLNRLLGFDGKNANPPEVLEFWEPGYNRDCKPLKSYDAFIESMENLTSLVAFRRPLETTHLPAVMTGALELIQVPGLPDVQLTLLHSARKPPASNKDCAYEINNASIVFTATIFGHRFLFTGDENGKERDEPGPGVPGHIEKLLLDLEASAPGTLKSQVLKVPHHGSETASTQDFIDSVDPSVANRWVDLRVQAAFWS